MTKTHFYRQLYMKFIRTPDDQEEELDKLYEEVQNERDRLITDEHININIIRHIEEDLKFISRNASDIKIEKINF